MNMMIIIREEKGSSVTNLDHSILEVKINKLDEQQTGKREQWSKHNFLWFIIGFAIDLANPWRFPCLCVFLASWLICLDRYLSAFLVPYILSIILSGMSLFYVELLLGQYYQQGDDNFNRRGLCHLILFCVQVLDSLLSLMHLYYQWLYCLSFIRCHMCDTLSSVRR